MFTGIIEELGKVTGLEREGENLHIIIEAKMTPELKIDQSIAHNGVCLTVVHLDNGQNRYTVTAIKETLDRSNIGLLNEGDLVNLERCMQMNGRLDGHIVQGHVDQTANVTNIKKVDGSWEFHFQYEPKDNLITVEKGSITINGTSLTVVKSEKGAFSVAIIPYTYEHTNFKNFEKGTVVNLEFDIIGKYVASYLEQSQNS